LWYSAPIAMPASSLEAEASKLHHGCIIPQAVNTV